MASALRCANHSMAARVYCGANMGIALPICYGACWEHSHAFCKEPANITQISSLPAEGSSPKLYAQGIGRSLQNPACPAPLQPGICCVPQTFARCSLFMLHGCANYSCTSCCRNMLSPSSRLPRSPGMPAHKMERIASSGSNKGSGPGSPRGRPTAGQPRPSLEDQFDASEEQSWFVRR